MNTKENQEAELSGEAKFHIEVCRAMALINQSIGCVSDANGLEAKNILRLALYDYAPTTKQVNEEVASGEVVAWKYRYTKEGDWQVSLTPTNETDMEWLKVTYKEFEIVPLYLHPPTPSPSNVLVEALQRDNSELKDFIAKAFLAHPNLDLDIEALATYSASTDSVSISRSEYEALVADKERLDWLEIERALSDGGCIHFDRHGIEWTSLFTISSQRTRNMPTIRKAIDEAIDTARKSS